MGSRMTDDRKEEEVTSKLECDSDSDPTLDPNSDSDSDSDSVVIECPCHPSRKDVTQERRPPVDEPPAKRPRECRQYTAEPVTEEFYGNGRFIDEVRMAFFYDSIIFRNKQFAWCVQLVRYATTVYEMVTACHCICEEMMHCNSMRQVDGLIQTYSQKVNEAQELLKKIAEMEEEIVIDRTRLILPVPSRGFLFYNSTDIDSDEEGYVRIRKVNAHERPGDPNCYGINGRDSRMLHTVGKHYMKALETVIARRAFYQV